MVEWPLDGYARQRGALLDLWATMDGVAQGALQHMRRRGLHHMQCVESHSARLLLQTVCTSRDATMAHTSGREFELQCEAAEEEDALDDSSMEETPES